MSAPLSRLAPRLLRPTRTVVASSRCYLLALTHRDQSKCFSSQPRRRQEAATQPSYTTDTYPIKRDYKYAEITSDHVDAFKSIFDDDAAVIDGVSKDATDDIEIYNKDWMKKYRGHTKLVLRPKTTEEVSKVLKYCNENKLALLPQVGN